MREELADIKGLRACIQHFQGEDIFGFGDSFFGGGGNNNGANVRRSSQQQKCKTVTQKIGNMVTTYTQCS